MTDRINSSYRNQLFRSDGRQALLCRVGLEWSSPSQRQQPKAEDIKESASDPVSEAYRQRRSAAVAAAKHRQRDHEDQTDLNQQLTGHECHSGNSL